MAPRRRQNQRQSENEPGAGDFSDFPHEVAAPEDFVVPTGNRFIIFFQVAVFFCLAGFVWLLLLDSEADKARAVKARLPEPLARLGKGHWTRVLPVHAKNRTQAWQLGAVEGRLATLLNGDAKGAPGALAAATTDALVLLLASGYKEPERDAVALLAALRAAKTVTAESETRDGVVSFVSRVFSLVNAMWLIGILGLTASISPVLALVLPTIVKPILKLGVTLWTYLRPLIQVLWRPILYYFAAGCYRSALDSTISVDIRIYTLLSVTIACAAAFSYILMVMKMVNFVEKDVAESLVFAGATLLLAPLASTLDSRLLGFFTAACVFAGAGMGMRAMPGGFMVGFESRSALDRSIVVSLAIVSVSIAVRLSGSEKMENLLEPFSSGMQIFGASAFYLAYLIKTSSIWHGYNKSSAVTMAVALACGIVVGGLTGLTALRDTAFVFSYLFALDAMMWLGNQASFFVAIFVASLMLTGAAFALHSNPAFVTALYSVVQGSGPQRS
jgi:hypothetical protein